MGFDVLRSKDFGSPMKVAGDLSSPMGYWRAVSSARQICEFLRDFIRQSRTLRRPSIFPTGSTTLNGPDLTIMRSEARPNVALREIDRHRDAVARRLREAVAEIEDAEFEDVSSAGGEHQT